MAFGNDAKPKKIGGHTSKKRKTKEKSNVEKTGGSNGASFDDELDRNDCVGESGGNGNSNGKNDDANGGNGHNNSRNSNAAEDEQDGMNDKDNDGNANTKSNKAGSNNDENDDDNGNNGLFETIMNIGSESSVFVPTCIGEFFPFGSYLVHGMLRYGSKAVPQIYSGGNAYVGSTGAQSLGF